MSSWHHGDKDWPWKLKAAHSDQSFRGLILRVGRFA